jgi:hypothetical protein
MTKPKKLSRLDKAAEKHSKFCYGIDGYAGDDFKDGAKWAFRAIVREMKKHVMFSGMPRLKRIIKELRK